MPMNAKHILLILLISLMALSARPQLSHYWNFNFNDESTMLAGAVVGGGAGVSSIYYNPANISESKRSNFTINAGLMQLDVWKLKNPLQKGEHINKVKLTLQPRFISFLIQPRNHPNIIFGFATMNKSKTKMSFGQNHSEVIDILSRTEGPDRYFASYFHDVEFNDQLVGAGGSYRLNEHFSVGLSMFFQFNSLQYQYKLDLQAYPVETEDEGDFYVANFIHNELVEFNTYELYWQAGVMWRSDKFGLGFSVKTPHWQLWADGKRDLYKQQQANITDSESGLPVPDYIISDSKIGKEAKVKARYPVTAALGFTFRHPGRDLNYYATMEFFGRVKPYLLVEAEPDPNMIGGDFTSELGGKEFISYASGANPVVNFAFGFLWQLSEKLELLGGVRTDFDYQNKLDLKEYSAYNQINFFRSNTYHLTAGAKFYIQQHYIMAGFQRSMSAERKLTRIANIDDPVEYLPGQLPLQGPPINDMTYTHNGLSFFFGATFSFGKAE